MRRFVFLCALAMMACCISVAGENSVRAKRPVKVACIGNSITYGMTIDNREANSYPAQLQQMLGDRYVVGNFGKNGATLLNKGHRPYMAQEEFRQALEFEPDIAVIHLGINDTDPRDYPDYGDFFVSDYVGLIDSLRSVNPRMRVIVANLSPLLSTHPRFLAGTRAWRDSIRSLVPIVAQTAGAELIDFNDGLRDHPEFIHDGIHPNAQGAEILAQTVYGAVTGNYGGLRMPEIYGDKMVLQRYKPLKIHGYSNAGDSIKVTLGSSEAATTADNRGQWTVVLPPQRECTATTMTVTNSFDTIAYRDVAVGEVWVASGQSNMVFEMGGISTFDHDKAFADDSLLRFFNMEPVALTNRYEWSPQEKDLTNRLKHFKPTEWEGSSAENIGRLSAVAWHFAKSLRDSLNVPVGIISNSIGGSPTEAWVDFETLQHNMPEILNNWKAGPYLQPWVQNRIIENVGNTKTDRHPYEPSYLFSAGIRPLGRFPIAGVIWYQGESNAHNIELHETLFSSLVDSWRANWESPGLPFIFVQLSSLDRPSWPAFRDSQRRLAKQIEGAAMAVSSDYGDSLDVHPRNKRPIGQRLARQALRKVYSMNNIEADGPEIIRAEPFGKGKVKLVFAHADGLTTSDGQPPLTFEVASHDGLYHWADSVEISNNCIILYSDKVNNINYVRYGWQPFTRANLVNGAALPASTFKIAVTRPETTEEGFECGLSGAFVGVANGRLIQAGGCNFPVNPMAPDSQKKFYEDVYVLTSDDSGKWTPEKVGRLDRPMAYGAAVSTAEGLVLIGGVDGQGNPTDSVSLLTVSDDNTSVVTPLPALPVKIDNASAAAVGTNVYVAGGNIDGVPSNALYVLDLNHSERGWRALASFPGNPRVQPVMAATKDDKGNDALYLWGGFAPRTASNEPTLNTDGVKYDVKKGKWSMVAAPTGLDGEEVSLGGGVITAISDGRLVAAGGVNKDIFLAALQNQAPDYLSHPVEWYRFNPYVFVFDPKTNRWSVVGKDLGTARAGAGIAPGQTADVIVVGGEIKPRIRTADIVKINL